jgi:hypothetical protein
MLLKARIRMETIEFEAVNEFVAKVAIAEMIRVLLENNPQLGVETVDISIREKSEFD